jgi:hypothetical protein
MSNNNDDQSHLYRLNVLLGLNEDAVGRRYLDHFGSVDEMAYEYLVLADDLRRALYAMGRAMPHEDLTERAQSDTPAHQISEIHYETDEYVIGRSPQYRDAVEDAIKVEFGTEHVVRSAATAERNLRVSEHSDAAIAASYRSRLLHAVLHEMEQVRGADSQPLPTGSYLLVILKE